MNLKKLLYVGGASLVPFVVGCKNLSSNDSTVDVNDLEKKVVVDTKYTVQYPSEEYNQNLFDKTGKCSVRKIAYSFENKDTMNSIQRSLFLLAKVSKNNIALDINKYEFVQSSEIDLIDKNHDGYISNAEAKVFKEEANKLFNSMKATLTDIYKGNPSIEVDTSRAANNIYTPIY